MADLKRIARSITEDIYSQGKMELFDQHFSPRYVYHDPIAGDLDVNGEKNFVRMLRGGMPDLNVVVQSVIAEGDVVCVRWTARGTHRGELFGAPPSGRPVSMTGIDIVRFEGEKVAEVWTEGNALGFMQQIGLVPKIGTLEQAAKATREARPS